MKLLNTLEETLRREPNYVADDGHLKKWVIISKAQNFDETLLTLLLSQPDVKAHFFLPVAGVLVFNQPLFVAFMEQKNYLNDSFTAYKNKIGLTINGRFLNQRNEVALVWPYKDCVLEGGQSREEQGRNEIFFNQTLAQDEITQLFDPKVLTNARRYSPEALNGESVTDFSRNEAGQITDNLIVKGNNLLALHTLKTQFAGRVKLIYIDPPYNTGNDGFQYNDRFNHSSWLTFMRNRLEVARDMLLDEGVIMIQIGDKEMHYLKLVADQIFKPENFIATIPRKTRSGKSDVPYKLSQDFDWIIAYTKSADKSKDIFQREVNRRYFQSDDFPNDEWRLTDLTTQRTVVERPNSDFILINPKNKQEFPVNPNRCWSVSKDTVIDFIERKKIVFPGDYDFLKIEQPSMRVFKSEEIEKKGEDFDKTYVSSDFLNQAMDDFLKNTTNKKGTDEIVSLFGEKIFAYPKNELLLQRIIEFTTKPGDIVLDYHLGSGTTAAVAHKMGRQYIGIEQMEYVETVSVERLKKVVAGEPGGISKTVNWAGGGSFIYLELKKYNQQFMEQIDAAADTDALLTVWEQMKEHSFLTYNIDLKTQDAHLDEFKTLALRQQKELLVSLLDKNQLYVNRSAMNDADLGVTDEDKQLTTAFYGH